MELPTFETCKHGKEAPRDVLRDLPDYQGGSGRHACPVCAYELGIREGLRQARAEAPPKAEA